MGQPVIMQTPNGAQYGFDDEEAGLSVFPDAKLVRYQDGTPIDGITEDPSDGDPFAGYVAVEVLTEFFGQFKRDTLNALLHELGEESPEKLKTKPDAAEKIVALVMGVEEAPEPDTDPEVQGEQSDDSLAGSGEDSQTEPENADA